jgi:serine/threonine protein kinase
MNAGRSQGTGSRGSRRDELTALVANALAFREEGRADWLEAACKDRPEELARVRAAVERAGSMPGLIARVGEHDGLPGSCLGGRFRILERIGAGAMGVVYLAEDLELGRKVACKIVHHGLMAPEVALQRFEREAHAMAAVQHPAVVTLFDRGRTAGEQVYIVMERIDGPSLSAVLDAAKARAPRPTGDDATWIESTLGVARRGESSYVRTVVRWTADLAAGLEAVHRAGVLHRDIKPSNILVRRDGRPVLLDFGVALLDDQSPATRSATSLGTPAYMPPEALERKARRSAASDVYSLAATLYHLLTLHAPYEGSPTQILTQLATKEPRPAVQLRPGLPRDLQAILDKGMARNPARRYATAAEFEADLRAFLEFRPISARPITSAERLWRRLSRSLAARGALAAVATLAFVFGAREVRSLQLETRRAEHAELARHFPPNFTVVNAANRVYRFEADRVALAKLLDAAAAVAVEPLPTFLLRASFRQDHGDGDGAAADMAEVAAFVDTPFARELARRYASAEARSGGFAALDLAGLPAATTAVDRYLLGYHLLRQERRPEALQLFAEAEVRSIPHAEELLLAFSGFGKLVGADLEQVALQRFADLVRLESRLGAPTASTSNIAGHLLLAQGRYDEALRSGAQAVALAPRAHVPRINAALAAFSLGRLDEARDYLSVAIELRPNYAHLFENLVWIEIAASRFDVAGELIRKAAPGLVPEDAGWGSYWQGVVASYAALDATDASARSLRVKEALSHFAAVEERVTDEEGWATDAAYRIALSLDEANSGELFHALADVLTESPENWWRQELLLRHMPAELDANQTEALRRILQAFDPRGRKAPK